MPGRIKNTGHRAEVCCGLIVLVVVGAFGATLWAQQTPAEPPSGPAPPAAATEAEPAPPPKPPAAALPRVGEVIGTVVNVRGGPGIAYAGVTKVLRGSRVTILGERDGWLKVALPENEYSWVSAQFVEKGMGDVGTITGDSVNVRMDASSEAESLGRLNRGFQVRIVEEREGWCRIKPLPGAIGWISADFVKEVAGETAAAPTIAAEDARKRWDQVEVLYKAEVTKENLADWDLEKLVPLYEALAKGSADPDIRLKAQNRLSQLTPYRSFLRQLAREKEATALVEKKIKELEERYRKQIEQLRKATEEPRYIATGVLKRLAISFLPPATHKIEGESRILFLLYSTDVDLSTYEGKRVGLTGTMTVPKGWETPLIRVTGVRLLTP